MVKELRLTHSGDSKRRSGSLWLTHDDVLEDRSDCESGDVVDLLTSDGDFRGRGFYSRKARTAVRVISESKVDVDETFFLDRLQRAISLRRDIFDNRRSFRMVHSDADFLPGLIVDRYGGYIVVQFRHPTLERKRDDLVEALQEITSARSIYARNDVSAREEHGLECYKGLLRGDPVPDKVLVKKDPFELIADLQSGQKTGYYLDQAENRTAFQRYIERGDSGLDCFSYTGAWGLHALHAGAKEVTFLDSSQDALALAKENLRRNGWSKRAKFVEEDAFDALNRLSHNDRTFDFIALDPPSFASDSSRKEDALRGYTELNLRSMRMLKDDGILSTSSCTAPVRRNDFVEVVRDSANDAHTNCRVLEERNQPPDHPWLPELPETLYLKCLICEISLV